MIHPVSFDPPNVTLRCDICGWTGDVAVSSLTSPRKPDGSAESRYLVLPCGNCGSTSYHPVGGGARPRHIQVLFVVRLMQVQGLTFAQAKTAVKQAAEKMDGPGRFALSDAGTLASIIQEIG